MSGENRLDGADKTRLCPTCRSPISVLAIKCRFCGEAVGRPKDEARKLTVDDLGGESSSDFNRSEDVMEALEAYRREEYMPQAAKEEGAGWLRRKRRGKGTAGKPDTRTRRPGAARSTGHDKAGPPKSIWSSNLGIAVAAFAAIVVLIIVAGLVVSQVNSRSGSIETQTSENFRNPAIAILAAGGPGAEALRAAHEALRRANTPDNQQIANQARALVEKEVLALMNSEPWDMTKLSRASDLAKLAASVDPGNSMIRAQKKDVDEEVAAYSMTIVPPLAPGADTVNLRLCPPGEPPVVQPKKKGEEIVGRFKVKEIVPGHVRFEDFNRKNAQGAPRQLDLSIDGTISTR